METPDRVKLTYNAADASDDFAKCNLIIDGIYIREQAHRLPENLAIVIGSKIGRLYSLNGMTSDGPVILKPIEIRENGILYMQKLAEPHFEEVYSIATEPPPWFDVHGDIHFDLEKPKK